MCECGETRDPEMVGGDSVAICTLIDEPRSS